MSQPESTQERLLSIGAVARGSGLSEAVLRMWERRYGVPAPVRLPSGHRRYRPDQVRHLRLVSEALAHGHKPGQVLNLDVEALTELVSGQRSEQVDAEVAQLILSLDVERLRSRFQQEQTARGILAFLDEFVAPMLAWVGTSWAKGDLEVRHEHMVTEVLQDHLRGERARPTLGEPVPERRVLLACLPTERHTLGLQMAALVCARRKVVCSLLGATTPIDQIVHAAVERDVQAVAISIPLSEKGASLYRSVNELRSVLDGSIDLLVGGGGLRHIRRSPSGVVRIGSMVDLDTWLRNRFEKGRH